MAQPEPRIIGLTGGIGTGKSRVAQLLRVLGAAVECSDRIVRELQAPGGAALEAIREHFGPEYLDSSGELDRARLATLVFAKAEARSLLNAIIHPLVYRELASRVEAHRRTGARVVVLDIPLLLEGKRSGRGSGAWLPFDLIALVYADAATQLERIRVRDQLSQAEAQARLAAQMPIEEKRALADVVIDNSGAWPATEKQVRALFENWITTVKSSAEPD